VRAINRREWMMLFPWQSMMLLALESNHVIALRLMRIAGGGNPALTEANLMLSEKIDACVEVGSTLMCGGTMVAVVARYRQHVAANTRRLSDPH
jgi:hypothetical protein